MTSLSEAEREWGELQARRQEANRKIAKLSKVAMPVILILFLLFLGAAGHFLWSSWSAKQEALPPLTAAQEEIKQKILFCARNYEACSGGFVQYSGARRRIDIIAAAGLGEAQVRLDVLRAWAPYSEEWARHLDKIVLPEDPEWEQVAVAFARQFTAKVD